ncbi:HD-GYP domain-containing protein [Malaciobacter marinus]|uniref:HD-GYP domain-containing protein n=1 Tax=Malaciobacter marinus TaxID=505249 RepID=UPI003B00A339
MDKKREILFNLNNFLLSTSIVLDYVNNEKKATQLGHLKRVSYIALSLGVILKLDNKQLSDLCSYSLCSSLALNQSSDNKSLCELSNEYVKDFPFIQEQKDILLYQKEHFDGSGTFGLKNEQIPLFSQIIFFATSLDEEFDLSNFNPAKKEKILNYVKLNENILFSKQIVDSFFKLNESINFWLDLQSESDILLFIYTLLEDFSQALEFEQLLKIAKIFLKLAEPQSKLIEYVGKISDFYALEYKDKITLQIAAGFCKIGKLVVPNDILQKIEPLDIYEKEQIRIYPYYTKKVLSNIMGFNDIVSWAMKVQERLDASGYIFGFENKSLSFKDRVLINANVYDALLQKKAYRKAYSKEEAIKIMKNESSKLDISITNDMAVIFKI